MHDTSLPRVLTTADQRRLGISRAEARHRVDTGRWQVLVRGALLARPGPPRREDWAMLGLHAAGPAAALSGWDAVRLRGIGSAHPPHRAVLIVTRGGANRCLGGVRIRPTCRPYRTWLMPADDDRLPWAAVVTPARAVSDTALHIERFDEARALVTASVQRGLCTPVELAEQLTRMPRGGSGWYRRALDDVLDGSRSVSEALASDRLRAARVPPYEMNVPVVTTDGVVVAVLDILWRSLRAALEIDSRRWHSAPRQWDTTLVRHNRLTRQGLAVEHHAPSAIAADRHWGQGVDNWLRRRACELGVPYVRGFGPVQPATSGPAPMQLSINRDEWLS